MGDALQAHLPGWSQSPSFGGTSFWLEGPKDFDANRLAREALDAGIVIEPGDIFFAGGKPPHNYFRLGFSAIRTERIRDGIEKLAAIIESLPPATLDAAE